MSRAPVFPVEDLTAALGESHVELGYGGSPLRAAWPL